MAQSKENTNVSARGKAAAANQNAGAPAAQTGEKRPRTTRRPYYNRRPRRPQQPREAAVPIHIYPLGGLGVGDVGNVVLRDRKHLSEDGLVIIVATVDSKTGKVLAGPDLVSRGFVYVRENESLMDGAQSIVENALDRCVDEHVRDWNSVKTRVREALSSYIYRRTKRSPMILPILMEV